MSPARSTASAGMKRKKVFEPSGSYVSLWTSFAATVPPVTFSWYQRGVALLLFVPPQFAVVKVPRLTVWSTQSDSWPPMFVYCACAIARICSVSRAFAGVDALATLAFGQQSDASWVSGPVKVEVETLFQSTCSL